MSYDAWGTSWGTPSAWGVAWIHSDTPPPQGPAFVAKGGLYDRKKRKRRLAELDQKDTDHRQFAHDLREDIYAAMGLRSETTAEPVQKLEIIVAPYRDGSRIDAAKLMEARAELGKVIKLLNEIEKKRQDDEDDEEAAVMLLLN